MALVDTQGFVLAVDRSLFGPAGRRWIEHKLPTVATNVAFIAVSAFGACVLVLHICNDYQARGYWAFLQSPKHLVNGIVIHLVARALRWHIDRMLGSVFAGVEALPDFFGAAGADDGDGDGETKAAPIWPWQAKDRDEGADSPDGQPVWWDLGIGGISASSSGRRPQHRRSRSVEPAGRGTGGKRGAAAKGEERPSGDDQRGAGSGDHSGNGGHLNFPDIFGSCRPGGQHSPLSSPPPTPPMTAPLSADGRRSIQRRASFQARTPSPSSPRTLRESSASQQLEDRVAQGKQKLRLAEAVKEDVEGFTEEHVSEQNSAANSGYVSDGGGASGYGPKLRGSRRRMKSLTSSTTASGKGRAITDKTDASGRSRREDTDNVPPDAREQYRRSHGTRGGQSSSGHGSGSRWTSIDKISQALAPGKRRANSQSGREQPQKPNYFTENDMDELLRSTFFIKMCDDASWLYVEDRPYEPELNWLLSLWGGYKIAPRFPGEVKQNEAHRMLFQCETGRNKGHVRIRSRATNTFLFFLGIKQPLTWVAWDRDVVGGEWEDIKIEWVGKPDGPEGILVGDERGRVVIRSRPMNAYVLWNGSRFTHVRNREGATVFMLQRMASSPRST